MISLNHIYVAITIKDKLVERVSSSVSIEDWGETGDEDVWTVEITVCQVEASCFTTFSCVTLLLKIFRSLPISGLRKTQKNPKRWLLEFLVD